MADTIAESVSQVGAWRVSAYTRGKTAIFDHCSLYRVQSDGFCLAVGHTPQGVWTIGAEAPGWGLVANESYTGTAQVGTSTYTFTGRALNPGAMAFNVAPEIFGQLKSGRQFVVTTALVAIGAVGSVGARAALAAAQGNTSAGVYSDAQSARGPYGRIAWPKP